MAAGASRPCGDRDGLLGQQFQRPVRFRRAEQHLPRRGWRQHASAQLRYRHGGQPLHAPGDDRLSLHRQFGARADQWIRHLRAVHLPVPGGRAQCRDSGLSALRGGRFRRAVARERQRTSAPARDGDTVQHHDHGDAHHHGYSAERRHILLRRPRLTAGLRQRAKRHIRRQSRRCRARCHRGPDVGDLR